MKEHSSTMQESLMKQIVDAIKESDCEAIKSLFSSHPEQVSFYTPFAGTTWLGYAAGHGSLETVKTLIRLGLGVNIGDKRDNIYPISSASFKGRHEVVAYLLSKGAILDVSLSVRNPLFSAIVGRSPKTVKLLLEAGIDSKVRYNSKTMENMDALAFARMQGEMECAQIIALWNAENDELLASQALEEAEQIAYKNAR